MEKAMIPMSHCVWHAVDGQIRRTRDDIKPTPGLLRFRSRGVQTEIGVKYLNLGYIRTSKHPCKGLIGTEKKGCY